MLSLNRNAKNHAMGDHTMKIHVRWGLSVVYLYTSIFLLFWLKYADQSKQKSFVAF